MPLSKHLMYILGYLAKDDVELMSTTTGATFARDDFLALSDVITVRPFGVCLNESELTFQPCDVTSENSVHPAMCRVPSKNTSSDCSRLPGGAFKMILSYLQTRHERENTPLATAMVSLTRNKQKKFLYLLARTKNSFLPPSL